VTGVDLEIDTMAASVDWDEPEIPTIMDVNYVEFLGRPLAKA
jgi:hypothetical protein